jgi:hypothetical protein
MVVQDLVWRARAAGDHDARAPVAPRGQVHGHPGLLEQRRELPGTIGSFYTALLGTESAKRKPGYANSPSRPCEPEGLAAWLMIDRRPGRSACFPRPLVTTEGSCVSYVGGA